MTIKLNVNVILLFYFIFFILISFKSVGSENYCCLKYDLFDNSQLVAKKAKILKLDNNTINELKLITGQIQVKIDKEVSSRFDSEKKINKANMQNTIRQNSNIVKKLETDIKVGVKKILNLNKQIENLKLKSKNLNDKILEIQKNTNLKAKILKVQEKKQEQYLKENQVIIDKKRTEMEAIKASFEVEKNKSKQKLKKLKNDFSKINQNLNIRYNNNLKKITEQQNQKKESLNNQLAKIENERKIKEKLFFNKKSKHLDSLINNYISKNLEVKLIKKRYRSHIGVKYTGDLMLMYFNPVIAANNVKLPKLGIINMCFIRNPSIISDKYGYSSKTQFITTSNKYKEIIVGRNNFEDVYGTCFPRQFDKSNFDSEDIRYFEKIIGHTNIETSSFNLGFDKVVFGDPKTLKKVKTKYSSEIWWEYEKVKWNDYFSKELNKFKKQFNSLNGVEKIETKIKDLKTKKNSNENELKSKVSKLSSEKKEKLIFNKNKYDKKVRETQGILNKTLTKIKNINNSLSRLEYPEGKNKKIKDLKKSLIGLNSSKTNYDKQYQINLIEIKKAEDLKNFQLELNEDKKNKIKNSKKIILNSKKSISQLDQGIITEEIKKKYVSELDYIIFKTEIKSITQKIKNFISNSKPATISNEDGSFEIDNKNAKLKNHKSNIIAYKKFFRHGDVIWLIKDQKVKNEESLVNLDDEQISDSKIMLPNILKYLGSIN